MATYQKGNSADTWTFLGNVSVGGALNVTGAQTYTGATGFNGDVTLGNAVTDTAVLNGRLTTVSVAGSAQTIDGDISLYGEGIELRYNMANWSGTTTTFTELKSAFLRAESNEANGSGTVTGMELYGVSNNVTLAAVNGLRAYSYIKGATAKSIDTGYAVHAELSWDAGAAATTIGTEMTPLLSKITGGVCADYTKLHGMIIRAGSMDGASLTYGNGILIQDDASMAGVIKWTNGINIASTATYGLLVGGACSGFAISITGSAPTAIDVRTGTYSVGISLAGTLTTGVFLGTCTTGIQVAGTITNAIDCTAVTNLTNLIKFDSVAGAVIANELVPATAPLATTVGANACIRVLINATPYYIPLYTTLHA